MGMIVCWDGRGGMRTVRSAALSQKLDTPAVHRARRGSLRLPLQRQGVGRDRQIVRLTPNGIHLASGDELDADVITTATGLRMLPYGGIELSVDEVPVDLHNSLACRWPIPLDSVHRPR
jgi:hypothetical protein